MPYHVLRNFDFFRELSPPRDQNHRNTQAKKQRTASNSTDEQQNTQEFNQKNNIEAARWFKKAADQGYVLAQYELGKMYSQGEGVEKSLATAFRYYKEGCKAKSRRSSVQVGRVLRTR